ncbi:60S acidic ribosomal protein P0 [Caligus rogercresseyi]|uniref:Large ribosomal subunit protein uL10 n=1 Tax=Caligus rogercresseyi TaxID=217165 RepID=A0A7T8JWX5_CALRO|nr:60S acidic ribosomal protein P0 [Caligus rogercresseyi]
MQQIRASLRGKGIVLMGKNTMMRKAIRGHLDKTPTWRSSFPTSRETWDSSSPRRSSSLCVMTSWPTRSRHPPRLEPWLPSTVQVPAQNTGLGPEKTSFFQALNIPTKITKGTIEIVQDVHLIKSGDKVGMSEATLLNMLKISPFSYGLVVEQV